MCIRDSNINNNWYTNTIAVWCLKYAIKAIEIVKEKNASRLDEIITKTKFNLDEQKKWQDIIEKMYYPTDEKLDIFLQQDGYLDKEQILVKDLRVADRPLSQLWSCLLYTSRCV